MLTNGSIRQDGNNYTIYQTQEDTLHVVLRHERNSVQSVDAALDVIDAMLDVIDAK